MQGNFTSLVLSVLSGVAVALFDVGIKKKNAHIYSFIFASGNAAMCHLGIGETGNSCISLSAFKISAVLMTPVCFSFFNENILICNNVHMIMCDVFLKAAHGE